MRSGLSAGKWQIFQLLLTESLVLALAGAALGCVLAWAELRALIAVLPKYTFPDEASISLNGRVLLFTIAIAVFTALLFGMAPGLGAFARNLSEPLKAGGRGNSGFRRGRMRNLLIISEVALSLILLTGCRVDDAQLLPDAASRPRLPAAAYGDDADQSWKELQN